MPTPPPLRPQDGAEIPGILRSAGDAGVMLVPRGRGTRPLVATRGARILEIAGIRGIDDLDAGEMVVTMLAGTLCEEVDRAARRHGLFLPPLFPGALQGTIGGLYSDPRESPLWPAIGRTRDSVLGIEGVRGDGTPFKAGGRVVKNVTGYDLTRLLCGARGRLGVVTRLHWRLFPRPGRIATARVRFEDEDALWEGLDGVRRQAGEPLLIALEEIDPPTVLVAEAGRGGVEVALLGRRLGALGGGSVVEESRGDPEEIGPSILGAAACTPKEAEITVRVRLPFSRWRIFLPRARELPTLPRFRGIFPAAHFGLAGLPHEPQDPGPLVMLRALARDHGGSVALEAIPVDWPQGSDPWDVPGHPALATIEEALRSGWDRKGVLWHRSRHGNGSSRGVKSGGSA